MAREENKVDPFSIVSSSKTVGEFLHQAFSVYKARLMVGQRKILPSGDIAKVFSWRTYAEMYDDVIRVYTGLVNELSIPPKSLISVCSKNSLNWLVADFAIQYAGCVSAPIHCEVDNDSIVQILNTAETVCVFCDRERLQTFTDILATKVCPKLKHVVLLDSGPLPANDGAYKSGTMWTLDDLKKVGSLNLKKEPVKVNPSDICHVIFTSGSTGKPKGVLMVHNDFVPAVCLKPNYDLYVSPGLSKKALTMIGFFILTLVYLSV